MLATYFKQYPPSLAAIAKRQAEAQKLPLPDVVAMDTSAEHPSSDTARTYTLSEHSEDIEVQTKTDNGKHVSMMINTKIVEENYTETHTNQTLDNVFKNIEDNNKKNHQLSATEIIVQTQNGGTQKPADSESSDEECISTTTFNFASPPPPPPGDNSKNSYTSGQFSPATPQQPKLPMNPCCPVHGSSKTTAKDSSKSTEAQLLHCGMCFKRFHNPRVLPCLHTFCEDCLLTYCPPQSLTLTCPVCRQQSILPKSGVAGLQINQWMSSMMDLLASQVPCHTCGQKAATTCIRCDITLCSSCANTHKQETDSHSVVSLEDTSSQCSSDLEETTLYCPSHSGQTLRFYCRACETAICSSCTDIEHQTHSTIRLGEAQEEQRAALQKVIDRVTVQLPYVKECVCELADLSTQLEERRAYAEGQMKTYFKALRAIIDAREKELTHSIATIAKMKQQAIDDQRYEMESWIRGVEKGCQFLQKAMDGCPAMGLVLVKKQLGEKLMEYANKSLSPAPHENAHLQFVTNRTEAVKQAIEHVGTIRTCSAVPHQTTALVDSLKRVIVDEPITVTVITRDQNGQRLTKGGDAELTATITFSSYSINGHSHTNGDSPRKATHGHSFPTKVLVRDMNDGSYEITFTPVHLGVATLSIQLFGQHINSSPFTMVVHDAYEHSRTFSHEGSPVSRHMSRSTQGTRTSKTSRTSTGHPPSHKSSGSRRTNPIEDDLLLRIGRRGRGKGEFVNPQGVCYSPVRDGRIAVADSNNQCVQVFTATGEPKLKFGVRGRKAGQLQRPTGVTVLPNNNYVVADYENRWISIFEPTGKYIRRIGNGKLLGPKGVSVDSQGNIIVVDNKASCVCLFHPSGRLLHQFGNKSFDENSFAGPHFVATNSKREIIVTDFHNHCVRVFDPEGEFLFTFGSSGEGNGQFNAPTGVAVDDKDNIIVADWGNARIQIFDSEGSFVTYVNTQMDPLYGPQGLTLDAEGHIIVADSGNHCLKMYKIFQ